MAIPSGYNARDVLFTLLQGEPDGLRTAPSGATLEDLVWSLLVAVRGANLVEGDSLPDQAGHDGEFLSTNGTIPSWQAAPAGSGGADLPSQTGNAGKLLSTNGTSPEWVTIVAIPATAGHAGAFLKNVDGSTLQWADLSDLVTSAEFGSYTDSQFTVNAGFTSDIAGLAASKVNAGDLAGCGLVIAGSSIAGRVDPDSGDIQSLTVTQVLDLVGSAVQGSVLFRGATAWSVSAVGNAGDVLTAGGAGVNPAWAPPAGGSLPSQAGNSGKLLTTNGTAASWAALSALLDSFSSTQGAILFRNSGAWSALSPGTSGYLLKCGGGGANPSWVAPVLQSGAGAGSATGGSGSSAPGNYALAFGFGCVATKDMSVALGVQSDGILYGGLALSGGRFSVTGDSQVLFGVARIATTGTTPAEAYFNGSSERAVIPANSAWLFEVKIVGKQTSGTSCAVFRRSGLLCRDGSNNTSIVGSVATDGTDNNIPGWSLSVSANDTNEALKVELTGGSGITVRWTIFVTLVAVSG